MQTPRVPEIDNLNPAQDTFPSVLMEFQQIWMSKKGIINVSGKKIDGVSTLVVTTSPDCHPIISNQYGGYPVVVTNLAEKVASRYLRGLR